MVYVVQQLDLAEERGERWGSYLSERQWGTFREDHSTGGDAWSSGTHEQSRSRADTRPIHRAQPLLQRDPHWQDLPLFCEYLPGANGGGIGASHQTGVTGRVGALRLLFGTLTGQELMREGQAVFEGAAAPEQKASG